MFNELDFIVFRNEPEPKENQTLLPPGMLSIENGTWKGRVDVANNRKSDDFANRLKDISRG